MINQMLVAGGVLITLFQFSKTDYTAVSFLGAYNVVLMLGIMAGLYFMSRIRQSKFQTVCSALLVLAALSMQRGDVALYYLGLAAIGGFGALVLSNRQDRFTIAAGSISLIAAVAALLPVWSMAGPWKAALVLVQAVVLVFGSSRVHAETRDE